MHDIRVGGVVVADIAVVDDADDEGVLGTVGDECRRKNPLRGGVAVVVVMIVVLTGERAARGFSAKRIRARRQD